MIDCRECKHGQIIRYKDRLCMAMDMPKPIEWMRDDRGECGLRGVLFEEMERKAPLTGADRG